MFRHIAFLTSLLSVAHVCAAQAEVAKTFIILGNGGVYAKDTVPKSEWFGIYCGDHGCFLSDSVEVTIGAGTKTGAIDDEPVDVAYSSGNPIALINGVALTHGKIESWFLEPDTENNSASKKLKKLGSWQLPSQGEGKKLTLSWVMLPGGQQFRHHVSDGKTKQFLFTTGAEGHYGGDTSMPTIYWVGDANRDGVADVILSFPDDNCSFDIRFYLSSPDSSTELLHKAAQISGREPACGC